MKRIAAVLFLLSLASTAAAYELSGNEIFIPIVGRTPGAFGTQWRTDVVITNLSDDFETEITMFYLPNGAEATQHRFFLAPLQSVTKKDILLQTFGVQSSVGTLWMGATNSGVKLSAHARIYNAGSSAGEFGQAVQGMNPESLAKTTWLDGLNGSDGYRTNVGIANPSNTMTFFSITWYDTEGEVRGSVTLTVAPWNVYVINDIFAFTGMERSEAAKIRVRASNNPLYTYASVVRNDSGDAYTIIGSAAD